MDEIDILQAAETMLQSNVDVDDLALDILQKLIDGEFMSASLRIGHRVVMRTARIATAGGPRLGYWLVSPDGTRGSGIYMDPCIGIGSDRFTSLWLDSFLSLHRLGKRYEAHRPPGDCSMNFTVL